MKDYKNVIGTQGKGMSFFLKRSLLEKMMKENGGSIVVTDPKLEYLNIKEQLNKPNGLVLGTLGKGTKIITFKKEDFCRELAPERAKITEMNIDGIDYVRMVY